MKWKTPENQALIEAVLALRTTEEVERFLRDLMTETEIEEFGKRYTAASMLADGVSYVRIQEKTGLSATTVARVSKWLQSDGGGYRLVLGRTHHHALTPQGRGSR
jgi:TrpR-related protein YerC/YecD